MGAAVSDRTGPDRTGPVRAVGAARRAAGPGELDGEASEEGKAGRAPEADGDGLGRGRDQVTTIWSTGVHCDCTEPRRTMAMRM